MIYMVARCLDTQNVVSLVVANQLPARPPSSGEQDYVSDITLSRLGMEFAEWLEMDDSFYDCTLEEISKAEWESYLEFGICKPTRIRAWAETEFIELSSGVERQTRRTWHWTFHKAPDLLP